MLFLLYIRRKRETYSVPGAPMGICEAQTSCHVCTEADMYYGGTHFKSQLEKQRQLWGSLFIFPLRRVYYDCLVTNPFLLTIHGHFPFFLIW
jgi:hypothetical protein